jgi:hypothetical protein
VHSYGLRQRRKRHEEVAQKSDEVDEGKGGVLPLLRSSGRHGTAKVSCEHWRSCKAEGLGGGRGSEQGGG